MEYYDSKMAERVWQRVQSSSHTPVPPPIREDRTIPELPALALETAEDYRRLARRYTGAEHNRLLQMSRQAQSNAAFLRRLLGHPPRNNRGRP